MRNVIVGVDGTPASQIALSWAAETVGPTGRIHAVASINPWTERITDAITGDPVGYRDVIEWALIDQWTADAGFAVGELHTSVSLDAVGPALDAAARSDDADAIVVGAHRGIHGRVARIGHATNRLLRTTRHPVIVVPDRDAAALDGGLVVVGIGHGDATRSAVRWVCHLAHERDVRVELLHALGDAPVFQAEGPVDFARHELGSVDRDEWERGRIVHFAELARALGTEESDLVTSTPPGLAALRLAEASDRSSLLVMGRHRSRLDGGRHTSQPLRHVLTHARCPVAVIPDHLADDLPGDVDTAIGAR